MLHQKSLGLEKLSALMPSVYHAHQPPVTVLPVGSREHHADANTKGLMWVGYRSGAASILTAPASS